MKKKLFISRNIVTTMSIFAIAISGCSEKKTETPAPQPIPVSLTTLETGKLIDSTEYVGTLEAVSRVNLAPEINGRIMTIAVREGDFVTQGQLIAELEPTQQQEDVFAASANVQSQIAAYNQSQSELKQREGERDSSSSQVAGLKADVSRAEANLKSALADLQRATADLELAQINFDRSKFLVNSGVLPTQDLDDKTRDLNSAKATVTAREEAAQAARSQVQTTKESLNSALSNLKVAQERIQGAKSNMDRAKANIDESRGNKGSIEQNLIFNRIVAPVDGIVGDFNKKKVGDYLNPGETFTTITNNDNFLLNVNVPIENLPRLKIGLPVEILGDNNTPVVSGSISFISPLTDQNNQSITVKISFVNDGSFKDEKYVRARLIWDTKPGVLIPTNIVSSLGGQKFVFVAKPGESDTSLTAKQVPITIGDIQGQEYQVLSGVQPGDRVVTSRILDLRDNTPITEAQLTSSNKRE
ncbi:efflux RND transporter periplasmic adaptor subunit [Geminocystis sp. NIES-3709]|uniref:efflux RND transporter periplasmic adaptor subunit n=1 Tax=Geminocystis sp. NIES-3709 TaxID=1617448 RepID=UPI0005FC5E6A|nr:efflux RND transporter periplasmic adaptor subunit [Geminocystis sp. NIES-3709]BAQ64992.1 probable RND efflux membrane fusion protein [Geminocystis sp. NIES-3709]